MSIIEKAIEKLEQQAQAAGRGAAAAGVAVPVSQAATAQAAPTPAARPVAPLIELPLVRLNELGLVTPDRPRSHIAEEFRLIKRPLLANVEGKGAAAVPNANLIMVTSAVQGEGKTFTAVNLAMSLSMEEDRTVLLVDGDMAKASAGELLGVPNDARGLIDVLEHDDIGIEDVLLHTSIPNLRIIPAGLLHERATELLASDGMRRLVQELSTRYPDRVVIFDSPPLLLTSESGVLASLMGQIVFVVAAEKTPPSAVTEAVGRIPDDKVVGMVLNKTRSNPLQKFGYGYGGYGYGYGYGYGEQERDGEGRFRRRTKNAE